MRNYPICIVINGDAPILEAIVAQPDHRLGRVPSIRGIIPWHVQLDGRAELFAVNIFNNAVRAVEKVGRVFSRKRWDEGATKSGAVVQLLHLDGTALSRGVSDFSAYFQHRVLGCGLREEKVNSLKLSRIYGFEIQRRFSAIYFAFNEIGV